MPPHHVFLCYAHESPAFRAQVKALAQWLRGQGLEVVSDHAHEFLAPEEGWQAWMQHGIEDAAAVLVICTPTLKARHEKREPLQVGRGATFEGVIISGLLYAACQRNGKVIPVLPDGGDPQAIPAVLRDFDTGLRFPSGNDGILEAIRQAKARGTGEPPRPVPEQPAPARTSGPLPGLLSPADDARLRPREGKVYGRDREVAQVLAFLHGREDGAVVYAAQVTGAGGIGKTEVCKAALRRWLAEAPGQRAFYVDVPDGAGAGELLYVVGRALGAPNVATFEELRPLLREGLYYLDNLEGVAETGEGRQALQRLREVPGVRVLASSRVSLPRELGQPIRIGALPADDALALFRDLWTGEALDDAAALRRFVEDDLGCHALSLTLMARLGESYGFAELAERWRRKGTALAADALGGKTRQDSLRVSLALTAEALRQVQPQALALWTLAALFPDGLDAVALAAFEASLQSPDVARQLLARHHVWNRGGDGRFHVLAPVGRFALDEAIKESGGFSWEGAKASALGFFMPHLQKADSIASTEEALAARREVLERFGAIARLLEIEARREQQETSLLDGIDYVLMNLYQFRSAQARELLQLLCPRLSKPARATKVLGSLEWQLGRLDTARRLYQQALDLFLCMHDDLGQANTLQSLGDLEARLGRLDDARRLYQQALDLFLCMHDGLGQANTLMSLGDLEARLGRLDDARRLYQQALDLFLREQAGLGQASVLKSLGDLEARFGRPADARHLYQQARSLFLREQNGLGQANTLQALGDLERRLGRLIEAQHLYQLALNLYLREQSGLGQANTLRSLGDLEVCLGHLNNAQHLYQQALQLYQSEQAGIGQANTLKSLGDLKFGAGNVSAALACYEQASLGDLKFGAGDVSAALACYEQALVLFAKEQEPVGTAYTWAEVARCHHAQGRATEWNAAIAQALVAADASSTEPALHYVCKVLIQLTGSFDAAQTWLEQRFSGNTLGG